MSVLRGKSATIIVCAGIAAYKTTFLVRLLIKKGVSVKVVMTPEAKNFVTPLSLSTLSKNSVIIDFNNEDGTWNNHVDVALSSDFLIVAPATSNTLSKMASAQSDNFAITTYLSANNPVFFAPAMDLDMYKNPYNKENIEKLTKKGDILIAPGVGELASGLEGEGRMAEPEEIVEQVENYFKSKLTLKDKKVLITAGPTHEALDPVRFIGNHSSGKMGFELALEMESRGAEVVLISGPTEMKLPLGSSIERVDVVSAEDMYKAVFSKYEQVDIAIASAAVADYKPANFSQEKIKKEMQDGEKMMVELVKNPDILKSMGKKKVNQFLVGFALETNNEEENALEKLNKKNLDAIVLNSLNDKGAGFKQDTNKVTIIAKDQSKLEFLVKSKKEVAQDICDFIEQNI